eukprot:TRINITY_DN5629_c0_g1_i3.p2 TRINITY_DN5629_c0_g1~~TRINITY_DN5629_c0_g1_i3.p2  ORF type:complete len:269 (+),score=25.42 TRINITY_DN5629_c0_g1_i3:49-855(+)
MLSCDVQTCLLIFFFFLMIRRPPRSTHCISSAASDVYKRQVYNKMSTGLSKLSNLTRERTESEHRNMPNPTRITEQLTLVVLPYLITVVIIVRQRTVEYAYPNLVISTGNFGCKQAFTEKRATIGMIIKIGYKIVNWKGFLTWMIFIMLLIRQNVWVKKNANPPIQKYTISSLNVSSTSPTNAKKKANYITNTLKEYDNLNSKYRQMLSKIIPIGLKIRTQNISYLYSQQLVSAVKIKQTRFYRQKTKSSLLISNSFYFFLTVNLARL